MLLSTVVDASNRIAATRSRKAKTEILTEVLRAAEPGEVRTVVAYLSGVLLQRRTGLGWRSMSALPDPATEATLTVAEVDAAFEALAAMSGPGSQSARVDATTALFERATEAEQAWLRGVVTGAVRQGALDALVQEALAAATGVPLATLRRAAMLAGSTTAIAGLAVDGGAEALDAIRLEVGRPVLPMLASSEPDVAAALARTGTPAAVDAKLDGIRLQAHKTGDEVLLVTRTLEDVTARLPEVAEVVRALPAELLVLDGEAIALGPDGRPRPFQETASRTASRFTGDVSVTPYFFDLLHVDGEDLLDRPGSERLERLERLVPAAHLVPRVVASTREEAEAALTSALDAGHEGVVVKNLAAAYDAGRRGAAWVKVKPVHTLDLVVLAVEEGSGRRRGWLSNIHLGARDPEGGFVMLGKTFKGMTDEMLAWQTKRFTELMVDRDDWVVRLRPEQVVEIAFDGVQRSSRYPGGLALRFARVVRYRDDKTAADADTIDDVRRLATWLD
ncbi:MAG TPA: ATP-dependent DNA ligase [Nocardioides sp.]